MIKHFLVIFSLFSFLMVAHAEVAADYVEGEKSHDILTPSVTAAATMAVGDDMAAQLLHALRLQMAKYDNDMRSSSGRRAWHGRLVSQEIHTNDLCKIEVYSNEVTGVLWRYRVPMKPVTVAQSNARLTTTVDTNGVPTRLAAARLRRQAEADASVSNVTVTVTAGEVQ